MSIEKLKKAKQRIEKAKEKKIVLETKIEALLEQLKTHGIARDDLDTTLESIDSDITSMDEELERRMHDFERKYADIME